MSGDHGICGCYDRLCTCGAEPERISVRLIGEDGNAFHLIGLVSAALIDAGQAALAEAFRDRAFRCRSYDRLLVLISEVVDVE